MLNHLVKLCQVDDKSLFSIEIAASECWALEWKGRAFATIVLVFTISREPFGFCQW